MNPITALVQITQICDKCDKPIKGTYVKKGWLSHIWRFHIKCWKALT